jgi:hypothetical protein
MNDGEPTSLEQIRAFLEGTTEMSFEVGDQRELYHWIDQTLRRQKYGELKRSGKGLMRQYLAKVTGLSRAQVARLIRCYQGGRQVQPRAYQRHRFTLRYTRADIELLAETDEAHETLSGPATQKILHREFHEFHDARYQSLARLSVAQMYRFRKSLTYRKRYITYQPTKPAQVAIGERRKPDPQGRPGYLRVDTVHQGDLDGVKGLYHIDAVDEVTQWQVVGATEQISEAWLLPVLQAMLEQFPFRIRGFHSDNGSEFINYPVAQLLQKLLVEQTKSRPRHSNDNGLVETKNGSVIRKNIGYGHIASEHAEAFDQFFREHLNPYLNFHRPCAVPEVKVDSKGKQKRFYPWYATPFEILRQLPGVAGFLRPDLTLDQLAQRAKEKSDTEAAVEMRGAKKKLFDMLHLTRGASSKKEGGVF